MSCTHQSDLFIKALLHLPHLFLCFASFLFLCCGILKQISGCHIFSPLYIFVCILKYIFFPYVTALPSSYPDKLTILLWYEMSQKCLQKWFCSNQNPEFTHHINLSWCLRLLKSRTVSIPCRRLFIYFDVNDLL